MAGLERRNGTYNIIIRFGGARFIRSLKTTDQKEAEDFKTRVEQNIRHVEQGLIRIPQGADIPTFLLTDFRMSSKLVVAEAVMLGPLMDAFFESIPKGSLETTTLKCMQIHRRHVVRLCGARLAVQQLTRDDLQRYVAKRTKEKGRRGNGVGANTISKELATFRGVWNWAVEGGKITGVFPRKGVRLPKEQEAPPFQTWKEIERQIRADVPEEKQADLWDCLYLSMRELALLLKHVEKNAAFPFIHPMFAFAAYTGARRGEIIRSQVSDIDLAAKVATIREKKRVRGRSSTRRVPIAPPLVTVLRK